MNPIAPRVALFADTFYETNGAANFLRRLVNYTQKKNYEFFCVRSGNETKFYKDGSVSFLDLKRGKLSIPLDGALKFDPVLWKHKTLVKETFQNFAPNVVHVTGLNDISQFGYYLAHFKRIPAVATWHTNAHEYAGKRLSDILPFCSKNAKTEICKSVEKIVFKGLMKLYFLAQMQLAPNEELVCEIGRLTKRPAFLLGRGVDADFFSPMKRRRSENNKEIRIGFVGRLRPEKNVRFLSEIEAELKKARFENYKFVIVGEGGERAWLEKNLENKHLTGEIFGEELAETYADLDLFVFPSKTDAFGNVVLEAMSSGVPAIVMQTGGPKFLIENGKDGFIAENETGFIKTVVNLVKNPDQLKILGNAAHLSARKHSWECVFEKMFEYYKMCMNYKKNVRAQ